MSLGVADGRPGRSWGAWLCRRPGIPEGMLEVPRSLH